MKKLLGLILCLVAPIYPAPPQPATVCLRTAHIYYRYYLIKRLEKPCAFLFDHAAQDGLPFDLLDVTAYDSPEVIAGIVIMKEHASIDPLAILWHDFCAYAYIYDSSFKQDFVKLIHTLCKAIKRSEGICAGNTTEGLLAEVDYTIDRVLYNGRHRNNRSASNASLHEVTVDMIARRFYILKRLQKSITCLELLHATKFTFSKRRNAALFADDIEHFQHAYIRETIEHMNTTNDLEPLIVLCDEVKQYRFAHDEQFLQEMLMNMFLVYKTILFKHYNASSLNATIVHEMNHVLDLYEHIDSLSLDETLEAIDLATDRLIAIQNERAGYGWSIKPWLYRCACAAGLAAIGWYFLSTSESFV